MGNSDFQSFYTTKHILHVPQNNSVDLPRVPYTQRRIQSFFGDNVCLI